LGYLVVDVLVRLDHNIMWFSNQKWPIFRSLRYTQGDNTWYDYLAWSADLIPRIMI